MLLIVNKVHYQFGANMLGIHLFVDTIPTAVKIPQN